MLRERVSIRDANTIVEGLGEAAAMTRNPVLLTEYVRQTIRQNGGEAVPESERRLARVFLRSSARADGGRGDRARVRMRVISTAAAGHPQRLGSNQPDDWSCRKSDGGAHWLRLTLFRPSIGGGIHPESDYPFTQRDTLRREGDLTGGDSIDEIEIVLRGNSGGCHGHSAGRTRAGSDAGPIQANRYRTPGSLDDMRWSSRSRTRLRPRIPRPASPRSSTRNVSRRFRSSRPNSNNCAIELRACQAR